MPLPHENELLPYQKKDILKACKKWKDRSVYFGHEMGFGKCCMTIVSWQYLKAESVLVICPASVRAVWKGEIEKWADPSYFAQVQTITAHADKLDKTSDIIVVSYDLAAGKPIGSQLFKRKWDVIVFDECHTLGNPKSKRTRMCLGSLYPRGKKCFFLSGSIQRDKIANVWPVFRTLCPKYIPTYWKFIEEYVFYRRSRRFGIQFLSGTNLDKLGKIAAENFLIRRKKATVLKELPEKLEQKILLETEDKIAAASREFGEEAIKTIQAGKVPREELATMMRELGESKVEPAMEVVADLLGLGTTEGNCEKLVIFCYHLSVFDQLKRKLSDIGVSPACISGRSSHKARTAAIKTFQEDDTCRVFLGTFAAAEGITLTAASTCLFVEMSWMLSQNEQAQDRLHRIGQKSTVYIKYLLLGDSLDTAVYNVYKRKGGDKRRLLNEQKAKSRR